MAVAARASSPSSCPTQRVQRHELGLDPQPALAPERQIDTWGNASLHWQLASPHEHLHVLGDLHQMIKHAVLNGRHEAQTEFALISLHAPVISIGLH